MSSPTAITASKKSSSRMSFPLFFADLVKNRTAIVASLHISINNTQNKNPAKKAGFSITGTPTGNRTPVTAVKGRCPNR